MNLQNHEVSLSYMTAANSYNLEHILRLIPSEHMRTLEEYVKGNPYALLKIGGTVAELEQECHLCRSQIIFVINDLMKKRSC